MLKAKVRWLWPAKSPVSTRSLVLGLLLGLLGPMGCWGAEIVTTTIQVTNASGTTNGQTITINGTARTWTNSVQVPATQILTNSTAGGAITNLFNQLATARPAGLSLGWSALVTNALTLETAPGGSVTVTVSDGWGAVTYATNVLTAAVAVRVPYTVEAANQQTNVASGIVAAVGSNQNTNAIPESAPAVQNLVGLTNAQTITGAKTFTGQLTLSNSANAFRGGALSDVTASNLTVQGTFVSPGTGFHSERLGGLSSATNTAGSAFGYGALAGGVAATAVGYAAQAIGDGGTAVGTAATASGVNGSAYGDQAAASGTNSVAIGMLAEASGPGAVALGFNAAASHSNSAAIGYNATTTADNQVMLGSPGVSVAVHNDLTVGGQIKHASFGETNTFPAGADLSFGRYALTTLAAGNNAAIPVGTNVFVEVSGPTAAFTINGINGSPNRDGKVLILANRTGRSMTIANESGVDPTAGNRIQTLTGADVISTNNGAAMLIYSGAAARWILLSIHGSAPAAIPQAWTAHWITNGLGFDGFYSELSAGGLTGSLIDMAILRTNWGATATSVPSFAGTTSTASNLLYGEYGALFYSTNFAAWPVTCSSTNTLFIVCRQTQPNLFVGLDQAVGGLTAANDFAQYLYYHRDWFAPMLRTNSTEWEGMPPSSHVITDVRTGRYFKNTNARIVVSLAWDGATCVSSFDGVPCATNAGATLSAGSVSQMVIGGIISTSGAVLLPLGWPSLPIEVEGWALFDGALTTEQTECVDRALRWLDPNEENLVFLGDSLATPNYLGLWDCGWAWQVAQQYPRAVAYFDGNPGQTASYFTNAAVLHRSLELRKPQGRVKRARLFYWAGINSYASSAAVINAQLNTVHETARRLGFEVTAFGLFHPGTNNTVNASYGTSWSTYDAVDALLRSRPNTYNQIVLPGPFFPDMTTNNAAVTPDGLHFTDASNTNLAALVLGTLPLAIPAATIYGTTNQLIFGGTNTAPATPGTVARWISVQVNGEGTAYRVPLYQ